MQRISGRSGPKGGSVCSPPKLIPTTFVALGVVLLSTAVAAQTADATAEAVRQGTTVAVIFLAGTLVRAPHQRRREPYRFDRGSPRQRVIE